MLKRVDPLRKELKDLETKAEDTCQKGEEITKIIAELEASIAKYKEEYAMVISDAIKNSVIKNDLSTVEKRFLLRLCHLEKSLLTALNEVKGRILDNNRIITELETLKEEAAEVQRKMEETDTVMAEVDRVSQQYLPLSTSCSAMYFTLESLNQ
uniref:Dynein heavy chain ATP-binding dynein motor region domain-containing protein n=1 Tax=Amphimedon queenslandica TaxID=400682 RepID=A0A1X7T3I1_AMPQE